MLEYRKASLNGYEVPFELRGRTTAISSNWMATRRNEVNKQNTQGQPIINNFLQ